MDLSQFAVDGLVVVLVYALVAVVMKPLIEVWLTTTTPAHDPVIKGIAVLLAVCFVFVDHGLPSPSDGHAWILLIVSGIFTGLGALGIHQLPKPTPSSDTAQTSQPQPAPIEHVVTVKVAPSTPEPRVSISGDGPGGVGTGTNIVTVVPPDATPKPETPTPPA